MSKDAKNILELISDHKAPSSEVLYTGAGRCRQFFMRWTPRILLVSTEHRKLQINLYHNNNNQFLISISLQGESVEQDSGGVPDDGPDNSGGSGQGRADSLCGQGQRGHEGDDDDDYKDDEDDDKDRGG